MTINELKTIEEIADILTNLQEQDPKLVLAARKLWIMYEANDGWHRCYPSVL